MFHLPENPGTTDTAPANHYGIHTILLKTLFTDLGRSDIAISYNRNMHPGIVLDFADQCPIRLARVHLRPCTSVYGKGGNTAILQLFGQIDNDLVVGIPSETGFHRNGKFDCFYHFTRDVQHQRNITEHSGSGSFSGHTFHRTTEINIENIRPRRFTNLCRFHHCRDIAPVNLDSNRTLFISHIQLLLRLVDTADQSICRNKFGIYHIRTKTFAHQPERNIGNIFHRRQEDGMLT